MSRKEEIKQIQKLGEEIGYGNIMWTANALWRKQLKDSNMPVGGAFVPVLIHDIENVRLGNYMHTIRQNDKEINNE